MACVNAGTVGVARRTTVRVQSSTNGARSMRITRSVSTVKRAAPWATTAAGWGVQSAAARGPASAGAGSVATSATSSNRRAIAVIDPHLRAPHTPTLPHSQRSGAEARAARFAGRTARGLLVPIVPRRRGPTSTRAESSLLSDGPHPFCPWAQWARTFSSAGGRGESAEEPRQRASGGRGAPAAHPATHLLTAAPTPRRPAPAASVSAATPPDLA